MPTRKPGPGPKRPRGRPRLPSDEGERREAAQYRPGVLAGVQWDWVRQSELYAEARRRTREHFSAQGITDLERALTAKPGAWARHLALAFVELLNREWPHLELAGLEPHQKIAEARRRVENLRLLFAELDPKTQKYLEEDPMRCAQIMHFRNREGVRGLARRLPREVVEAWGRPEQYGKLRRLLGLDTVRNQFRRGARTPRKRHSALN